MDYPCHALCAINKHLLCFKIRKMGRCWHNRYRGGGQDGACRDNTAGNKALFPFFASLNLKTLTACAEATRTIVCMVMFAWQSRI